MDEMVFIEFTDNAQKCPYCEVRCGSHDESYCWSPLNLKTFGCSGKFSEGSGLIRLK